MSKGGGRGKEREKGRIRLGREWKRGEMYGRHRGRGRGNWRG